MRILTCTFLLVSALGSCPYAMADEAECSLGTTLDAHLAAIQSRDLDALLVTVTSGDDLTLIFPDGEKLDRRSQYVEFHESWFADKSWQMDMKMVNLMETAELGHALVKYRYTSPDASGNPKASVAWLALTFAKEDECWRLVFDQNTRIEPVAP